MLKRLLVVICLLIFALPVLSAPLPQSQQPVNFKLSAKKANLLVGEPIDLTYALTNNLATPVNGRFELRTSLNNLQVFYRNNGGTEFTPINQLKQQSGQASQLAVDSIVPRDGRAYSERLLLVNGSNQLIFTAPGVYEFQVKGLIQIDGQELTLTSNIIRVDVAAPNGNEKQAFQQWNDATLLAFVQGNLDAANLSIGLNKATAFLQAYPDSPYAQAVKPRVISVLNARESSLSPAEKQLLFSLKRHQE